MKNSAARRALRWGAALMLSWCAVAGHAQPQPLRIGLVGPFSGGSGDFGNSARFGAELAVKEINAVGGFLGRPLELVIRDDQAVPDVGRQAAEDLVLKEKVAFTIGYCNTGVAMKALDVFQDNKHLLMVPCSQGTAVTTKYPPAQSYIFRVAPPDLLNAKFLIAEIVDRRKLQRVAIFADETGYGEGGLQDLSAELAKRGLKPVYVARFPLGVTSLHAQMRAARDAGADAIVAYTVGPEQAVAVRSRLEVGYTAPFFAPWTLSFRSVLENAGQAAVEGTMMVQTIIQDNHNERRASFLARYFKHSNETRIGSLMAAAQTYDAVHLMLWALFQAKGDTSGDALKRALETLERPYQGVVTTYARPFSDRDHDAIAANMLWLGVWRKGQIEYYYQDDARRTGVVRRKDAQ
ncbi:ABC transporter substrate-binding protein [Caldimonas thermodepolymerans]|uniref:Amino acid/amide ABC transporter substrate-binding protein (HAAT family) n=2 Tax=Caldimonas thermodepolymerans TaxID=215580 RepID=A0AA46DI24_9BURK|nr:ABC transporter substrate-binding protein [Caldimonas thermodepolymerans]TCP09960.1 amino acid/amide ABC transporter substrate-binding protein (HAAT family) [Caldimonas thermodepolymerans]